ncbi:MAG: 50S ribosomal protein L23 [Oligoflexia bacterium]|nr:50S ribosomal protein L23 [Oligoflexia bacterium]
MPTNTLAIIKKPLITEKNTMHLQRNVYAFEVAHTADKNDIARAVEVAFKVKVVEVRTMNSRGRQHRMGRFVSKVDHYKKALVRLADGQKIKIFEGA